MNTESASRLRRMADAAVFFLIVLHIVMRLITGGQSTSDGTNLFIHLLVWIAAMFWLLSQAMRERMTLQVSGLEPVLMLFAVLSLLSFLNASYRYPALMQCLTMATHIVLFFLILQVRSTMTSGVLPTVLCSTLFVIVVYSVLQRLFLLDVARMEYEKDPGQIDLGVDALEEWGYRLKGNEVFGTFTSPNTLAGFLALCLPLVAGWAWGAWKNRSAGLYSLLVLAFGLIAMFWTGSLGGWMALAVGAAFFAVSVRARSSGRWKKILRYGSAALIVVGALFVIGVTRRAAVLVANSESLDARGTYASAAAGIIGKHPLWGVGLGNFGDFMIGTKPEEPDESVMAHNDYLQLWAEMGIFALALFAIFIFMIFRKAARAEKGPEEPATVRDGPSPWTGLAAGVLAIGLAFVMDDTFDEFHGIVALAMAVLWGASYAMNVRADLRGWDAAGAWGRIGLTAGIAGFLTHMAVDYDFMVPGAAAAFFLVCALLVLRSGSGALREVSVKPFWAWGGVVVMMLIVLPLMLSLLPNLLESETALHQAKAAVKAKNWDEAQEKFSLAVRKNPLNADLHHEFSDFFFRSYQILRVSGPSDRARDMLNLSLSASNKAIYLRRHYAPYYVAAALKNFEAREFYLKQKPRPGTPDYARAMSEFTQGAREMMERAVALHPTQVGYHYRYGKMLEELREPGAALDEYRKALRLHETYRAKQDRVKRIIPKRFMLAPEAEAEVRKKLAGTAAR